MRTSTEVSSDDYRDFVQSLAGAGVEEAKALEDVQDLSRSVFGMYVVLAAFFGALIWFVYQLGVDGLLNRPFVATLTLIGLLSVPIAIVWLKVVRRLRGDLKNIANGNIIDQNALRNGLNIGETDFDWDHSGVTVRLNFVHSFYSWSAFQELKETSTAFHLMIAENSGLILPKRAFDDDSQRQEFQTFFAGHVGLSE